MKTEERFEGTSREPLELLSLSTFPTMPLSWAGNPATSQLLAWGDFYLVFAVDAPPIGAIADPSLAKLMQYPYSLTAFYHRDKNPHGPSARPVFSCTIEKSPVADRIMGVFVGGHRIQAGHYSGPMEPEAALRALSDLAREHLGVSGEPDHIGRIIEAAGHPSTGIPQNENLGGGKTTQQPSPGCLLMLLAPLSFGIWLGSQ